MVLGKSAFLTLHMPNYYAQFTKSTVIVRIALRSTKGKLSAFWAGFSRATGKSTLKLTDAFFKYIDAFNCRLYVFPFGP